MTKTFKVSRLSDILSVSKIFMQVLNDNYFCELAFFHTFVNT